jgi:TFIIF-interacting CTD phosphatase-like protein
MYAVLDLDKTLISAVPSEDFEWDNPQVMEKALEFELWNMHGYYLVFERPGLQEFLDYLFKNFKVLVWSAATREYVLFVVNKVILKPDPTRKLECILFKDHCELSKRLYNGNIKDLRLLWEKAGFRDINRNNSWIVDDLPEVYHAQPRNTIKTKPFEFSNPDSENDKGLQKVERTLRKIKS